MKEKPATGKKDKSPHSYTHSAETQLTPDQTVWMQQAQPDWLHSQQHGRVLVCNNWPDEAYSLLLLTGVIWAALKCHKPVWCQWSHPKICHSLHGNPELVCTSSLRHRLRESQESSKELTAITCPALFPILSSWNTTTHCYGYTGFDTQLSTTLSTAKSAPPGYRRNPAQDAFSQQLLPVQLFPCTSLPPPSTHCRTKSLRTVHMGKKHNYTHTHTHPILSPS